MNENQRTRGSKRRTRVIDAESKRTTGEEARVQPSVSIPGFSPDELKLLSDKLELLDMAMSDWSPLKMGRETADKEDNTEQIDIPENSK